MNCQSIEGGIDWPEIFISRISCHHILHTNWYRKHQSPWSTLLAGTGAGTVHFGIQICHTQI